MAARVIHFGVDECYRLPVLRRAGYDIHRCSNLVQFRAAIDSDHEADAIMVDDSDGCVPEYVISLARTRRSTPLILFPHYARDYTTQQVDLVVPTLTSPHEWLLDLANLIIQSQALRAASKLLCEQSEQLRRESAVVREQSRRERARSRHELSRNANLIVPNADDHSSDAE